MDEFKKDLGVYDEATGAYALRWAASSPVRSAGESVGSSLSTWLRRSVLPGF
jgi:hypothetical protein